MLYSYDIFDTIVYRKVLNSTDVFRLLESKVKEKEYWPAKVGAFSECREKCEFLLRRFSRREITIEDIYNELVQSNKISTETADKIRQLEFEIEKSIIFLNESIVKEIKHHIEAGEHVILISDMYWHANQIRELLVEKDPIFKETRIYISCDLNASKKSGDIFPIIQKIENVAFSEWVHCGDNKYSDFYIPQRYGIKAIQVSGSKRYIFEHKLKGYKMDSSILYGVISEERQKSNGNAFDLGISVAAPMVYQYVDWILNEAIRRNIHTLYFVLRDGYILKLIADRIIEYRNMPIHTDFLFGSRVAWRFPELSFETLEHLSVWEQSNWIFREPAYAFVIFERLGFEKDDLKNIFDESLMNKEIHSFSEFILLIKYALKNKVFKQLLAKNIEMAKKNLEVYLRQSLKEGEEYAFVDTNSTGKTQRDLECFMKSHHIGKIPVRFFYHTYLSEKNPDKYTQFVFLKTNVDDRRFPEALFRAPYNPCYGYEEENGHIKPRFAKREYCAWEGRFDYSSYLEGILTFVDRIEKEKSKRSIDLTEYVSYLTRVVNFDVSSPDLVKQMANIPFNTDMNGEEIVDFYPPIKISALFHPFTKLIFYPKGSYFLKGGMWPFLYRLLFLLVKIKRRVRR